ncbi:MAG: nucleotidyltransferase domain-containing protein [Gammaproteobacteria bacterium]
MLLNSGQRQGALGFYRQGLGLLRDSSIPYLVGGSYALDRYIGIERDPKDLDLFVRPQDSSEVFQTFAAAGYETRLSFPIGSVRSFGRITSSI